MRALSIRQPWAWLIVRRLKPVENREIGTPYRGPLLVHASKTLVLRDYRETAAQLQAALGITVPPPEEVERGGVVGLTQVVDCVQEMDHPLFTGPFGYVLADSRPLPFLAWKGQLGFFDIPAHLVPGLTGGV